MAKTIKNTSSTQRQINPKFVADALGAEETGVKIDTRQGPKVVKSGYQNLLAKPGEIISKAKRNVVREIDKTQVLTYWEIGREIVEFEQKGKVRGEYGERLIERLSGDMTRKFGRGFSGRNLRNMRAFYLNFPIWQTVSAKSLEKQKYEPVSCKSIIQQTLSVKFQKSQILSVESLEGEMLVSWN